MNRNRSAAKRREARQRRRGSKLSLGKELKILSLSPFCEAIEDAQGKIYLRAKDSPVDSYWAGIRTNAQTIMSNLLYAFPILPPEDADYLMKSLLPRFNDKESICLY